jgi:hypothetical protein
MIVVRIVAVLLIIALVLVLVFLTTRNRRYLQWAWRVFLTALIAMLGLMLFYFVERLVFAPTALFTNGGAGLG